MAELPSGTVTMLFSDIEGSTGLLSRLGLPYADALDGQRQVLRRAWTAHGGTEMGTEGDSFFVAFATAPDAVAAATQAQRELAGFSWPECVQVRVRMGVHTGNPTVHDGGYVGMDVHRAARIAGAAHGGQVVVSAATADLVTGRLPEGVALRNLGSHRLKDIPAPEHLFQLAIDGLRGDFPPIRSLGSATTLPMPTTPLVGRDGELAELDTLLRSPEVRLVTLTGPGGSGKTRLAIGLAQRLVESSPDGVYFVPLAAVTTPEVMLTSIAEALDVPPQDRTPPRLFDHVAHRSALMVLDNLEQLVGADSVVAQLMGRAPQLVVVATSRRPLHLPAEHEHPVPPLELPDVDTVDALQHAGAVQLFVQQARKVRPSFGINAGNAADVASLCRALDGLPLAIELASARSKLLSPRALLARLDTALDMTATGSQVPSRQKTLRDTIAWSYELLTPPQRTYFRRMGVFVGGADLAAITAIAIVTEDATDGADPLDAVTDLVDASLVTVTEAADGEPRIGMLETVRSYAYDQLSSTGDLDVVREGHARHFLDLAERSSPLLDTDQRFQIRTVLEIEHDNLRSALNWALQPDASPAAHPERVDVSLRLCIALGEFWGAGGHFAEGRQWLERAIERAGGVDSPELAEALQYMAGYLRQSGDLDQAQARATTSLDTWRRVGGHPNKLARALDTLAAMEMSRGRTPVARTLYEEALTIEREAGDKGDYLHGQLLSGLAIVEYLAGNYQRSLELNTQLLTIADRLGNNRIAMGAQHNIACALRCMGRAKEAQQQMRPLIPHVLKSNEPNNLMTTAEDYAAVLADLGDHRRALRLIGAADALRERHASPRWPVDQAEMTEAIAKTHTALDDKEWEDAYQAGRTTTIEDALSEAHAGDAAP